MSPTRASDPAWWEAFKGDRRVVVVRAASGADPHLAGQRREWEVNREDLIARDVAVLEWIGPSALRAWPEGRAVSAKDALRALAPDLEAAAWRVLLIGRDGGLKASWETNVKASEIFALIDAMPMGRREKTARGRGD